MKNRAGFTTVELLTIIGVAGMLVGSLAPDFLKWSGKETTIQQANRVHELTDTARTNALSDKECLNGEVSQSWRVVVNSSFTDKNFRLYCRDVNDTDVLEEPLDLADGDYLLEDAYVAQASFYKSYGDANFTHSATSVEIEFPSGSFAAELTADGSDTDLIRLDFVARVDASVYRRLCMDRHKGYAYFSDSTDCSEFVNWTVSSSSSSSSSSGGDCTEDSDIDDLCGGGVFAGNNLVVTLSDSSAGSTWSAGNATCNGLSEGGHGDWYLLDLDGIATVYKNKNLLTNTSFSDDEYWSSTETDDTRPTMVNFLDGEVSSEDEDNSHRIRCSRDSP